MTGTTELPFPILLTDCSAPGARIGVLGRSEWLAYRNLPGETGTVLFDGIKEVLSKARIPLSEIQGFAYCEGPGSTLGIRINAMALRTLNSLNNAPIPVFAYKSLEAAAVLIRKTQNPESHFAVFSDLRKNAWNYCRVDRDGSMSLIELTDDESKETWPETRFFLQQRIHSPGRPQNSIPIDYELEPLGHSPIFRSLFRKVKQPAVFQTTTTEFKKWEPKRHR